MKLFKNILYGIVGFILLIIFATVFALFSVFIFDVSQQFLSGYSNNYVLYIIPNYSMVCGLGVFYFGSFVLILLFLNKRIDYQIENEIKKLENEPRESLELEKSASADTETTEIMNEPDIKNRINFKLFDILD